ncbi:MAG: TIM barrel protein [Clostridiales Family XIII bacterium]|jgi:hypothetical protein|nr:TIM barrel protein [Clostridiales Family XIII bacterium]
MREKGWQMADPKLYLAIDNCFAYKRWTRPKDWARMIRGLGLRCVEASADTEMDPLYMGPEYLKRWVSDVQTVEAAEGVEVVNLYSGHGTYTTLGLAHTDMAVRRRFVDQWFKPLIDAADALDSGVGFFVHGFPEFVLQDNNAFEKYTEELLEVLSEINAYAAEKQVGPLSIEQMYTPMMHPWTIKETVQYMIAVKQKSGACFYFTEDLGHHLAKFIQPCEADVVAAFAQRRLKGLWLGTDAAYEIYRDALAKGELTDSALHQLLGLMRCGKHLFTEVRDADCYEWLRAIGCYAPIIHLQQTDGTGSAHLPFTKANNEKGKISGTAVLQALSDSYNAEPETETADIQKCDCVYMTLEPFFSSLSISQDILDDCKESVEYWRRFIPEDGIRLSEAVGRLEL